jgi:hypothetical protein
MGPNTKLLTETLSRQVELLSLCGEGHWKAELSRCLAMIFASDYAGIERLLGMYGGMGSLNDLVLGNAEADEEFFALRSRAYDLAKKIERAQ